MDKAKNSPPKKDQDREARLAKSLRDNLRRRKAAVRKQTEKKDGAGL